MQSMDEMIGALQVSNETLRRGRFDYMDQDLYQLLNHAQDAEKGMAYLGICFGMIAEEDTFRKMPYERYLFLRVYIYRTFSEMFQLSESGFVVKNEENCCSLITVIQNIEQQNLIQNYIKVAKMKIFEETGFRVHVGIGMPVSLSNQLLYTYECAQYAYDLYFFEEDEIIEFEKIQSVDRLGFEGVYEPLLNNVYNSIVAKDNSVYDHLNIMLEAIASIHYGNKYATINRCIMFIGELGKLLRDLNPNAANWRIRQETVQENLRYHTTYRDVKAHIQEYYHFLIPVIYQCVDQGSVNDMVRVRQYIDKNYMQDLSIKSMSEFACLSPNYFSTAFKNATGKNFKCYLTEIRMERALQMVLQSDQKTYEIAEAVGYHNVRFFVEAFKACYKMSPLEYRKKYKIKC